MTPYERVQLSRQRTAGAFPLPSVLDCIRYAIYELAKYDDALLRQERTDDKRNNDKAHDPRVELGQCGYMLLSAAMQMRFGVDITTVQPIRDGVRRMSYYSILLIGLARAMSESSYGADSDKAKDELHLAWYDWAYLCDVHGWPVDSLIDDTCARFEAKHARERA